MRKMHRLSHSLLTVLSVAALVVLVTVCLLTFSVTHRFLARFESYVLSSRYAETVSTGSLFSQDLEALFTLMHDSLSDSLLNTLRLYLSNGTLNYRYLEIAKRVENKLSSIEASLDFSGSVEILLPDVERTVTSSSIVRFSDSGDSLTTETILDADSQSVLLSDGALIFRAGSFRGLGEYRHDVVICCRVSRTSMVRYLSRFVREEEGAALALFIPGEDTLRLFASSGEAADAVEYEEIARLIAGEESGSAQYISAQGRFLITWQETTLAALKLCQLTPMEVIDAQMQEYRSLISAVLVLILLLLLALVLFFYFMVLRPLLVVQRGLKQVENGDLSVRLGSAWSTEFQQIFGQFDRMTGHLQQLIEREYELRLLSTRAELKQLRYQINPHFLYNAYFNLRAMLADEEYDQSARLAGLMGKYLRYITVSGRDFAPLSEEMAHAAAYMDIQRMRFGSRIDIQTEPLPAWAASLEVPRLVLQPLIENAFEHGIRQQEGQAVIAIRVARSARDLSVFVEDNGSGATDALIAQVQAMLAGSDARESVALVNIHRRLVLLYPPGSGLFVSRSALGGFCSEIRMKEVLGDAADADCG